MILPPDTKRPGGPQSTSTESESDTVESSSRSTTPTPRPISTHPADRPLPYSQVWRNPNGTHEETSPLLEHEYMPAPPYSPTDPTSLPSDIAAKTTAIARTRRRFWMALPIAILIYLVVLLIADLIVDILPDVDIRPGDPDRHHGPGKGTPAEQERSDGDPLDCASFSDADWREVPREGKEGMRFYSQRKNVYIKTENMDENFLHIVGPGSIANVFVDTYPSWAGFKSKGSPPPPQAGPGEAVIMANPDDVDEVELPDDDKMEAMYGSRGMIRIGIEPVVRVFGSDPPNAANSYGWRMLAASRVCVMEKSIPAPNKTYTSRAEAPLRHQHRHAQSLKKAADPQPFTSQGLGIYTQKPRGGKEDDGWEREALGFNVYVSLPEAYPPTFMDLLLIAMGYDIPRDYVRTFDIHGDVMDVTVNAAQQRTGRFSVDTGVGNINFKRFVAEYVKVNTAAGAVTGSVDVASMLNVETASGEIELEVSLATAPSPLVWTPPGVNSTISATGGRGCDLPAVVVNARTNAGSINMSYNKWAQSCRGLKQNFHSDAGSIRLRGHPNYEGTWRSANQVGSVTVDKDETAKDPTERGRRRTWTWHADNNIGSSCAWGEVSWSSDRGPRGLAPWKPNAGQCPVKGLNPGAPDYDPMASTTNVESRVGSINLLL